MRPRTSSFSPAGLLAEMAMKKAGPLSVAEQTKMAVEHMRKKRIPHADLVAGLAPSDPAEPLPTMISPAKNRVCDPFSVAFRVPDAEVEKLSETRPPSVLRDTPDRELWIVYQNDGRGINPGGGSDQGPTAAFKFFLKFNNHRGLVVGATIIDMETPAPLPNHPVPEGKKASETTYGTKGDGPFVGIRAAHIGFTVYRGGGWRIDSMSSLGQDSAKWGEKIQDAVHDAVNSPHFDWQRRADKLFAEQEFRISHDGGVQLAQSASFQARLVPQGAVRGGTRRTEAEFGAKLVLEKATVFAGKALYMETSFGGVGRGFMRYNDGRSNMEVGIEGGFIGGIAASMGRFTVRIDYEDIQSSDPSRQTQNAPGDLALGQANAPLWAGTGQGGHRTGTVSLIISF